MHLLRRTAAVVAAAALVLAGGSAAAAKDNPSNGSSVVVSVQTYNMYFGANLTPLFAPGANPIEAATAIWAEMQASRIPERARAVAELIAEEAPDLVGLQEVSTWRSAPASFTPPQSFTPTGPFVTDYDALALLMADLAERGTPYEMVVANTNFSNEPGPGSVGPLPVVTGLGPTFRLATFTDRDVILVKRSSLSGGRIEAFDPEDVQSHTYQAKLTVLVSGNVVSVPRGWSSADVTVRGRTFTFFNTHFEAYGYGGLQDQIRNPQAEELAGVIESWPHPVVLVGDVNVRPTMCKDVRFGQPEWPADQNIVAYATLEGAGLTEVWPMVYPYDPCGSDGWTSGQDSLDGAMSTLDHRIDDVFVSEGFSALEAVVVGDEQADRTPSGLWPSDHASTWAKVRLDNANKG